MRGTFFAKPLEIILEIEGERWKQGESVRGKLTLKNRGSQPVPCEGLDVRLCRAQLSQVKKKAEGAFKPLQQLEIQGELAPGSDLTREFEFQLGLNAPITDSISSLFVCCGTGSLQLQVEPSPVIQEFVSLLLSQHHFGFKGYRFSKDAVEAKLSAPDGKSFATLDHLALRATFAEESGKPPLSVTYSFHVKKVGATPASFKVEKSAKEIEQTLLATDYFTPSGRVNFDAIGKAITEAVSQVQSKVIF